LSKFHFIFIAVICISGFTSCADDTEVGSGLLSSEDLEVQEISDFDITIKHIPPSPLNQIRGSFTPRHSVGTLDSREFGQMSASFYTRPVLSLAPVFNNGTFDSVALTLRLDTSRTYGSNGAQHNLEVFLLEESIDNIDTIATDQTFATSAEPIGTLSRLTPSQLDSTVILDFRNDTTYVNNLAVIPLDSAFGQAIFDDTVNNGDVNGFLEIVKGFYVTSESNNSLLQIDLADLNSSLLFYYKDSLGDARQFPYRFGGSAPLNFDYEIEGSEMESAITDSLNQSVFYVQGHAGTVLEIDISDILSEQERFINFVTLEFFVSQETNIDTSLFSLPQALDILIEDEEGNLVPIIDLAIAQAAGQATSIFDGFKEVVDNNVVKYKMNLTNHIKTVFKEVEDQTTLYLTISNRVDTPNNVILYGPDHPVFPAKLRLTYTKS